MVKDNETGLLPPIYGTKKFTENSGLCISLAEQGNKFIQKLTWEKTFVDFKNILEETK